MYKNKIEIGLFLDAFKSTQMIHACVHLRVDKDCEAFINQILKLQTRAVRLMNKKEYRAHTDPLFKSENILNIDDLHKFHVSFFTHDQIYKRLPDSFSNFYKFTNMHTRQIHTIYKERPEPNLHLNYQSIAFQIFGIHWIKNWRETQTINKFKNKIKYNILSNYNENVKCKFSRCPDCFENSRILPRTFKVYVKF